MNFVVALDCEIKVVPVQGEKVDIDALIEDHLHAVMGELLVLGAGDPSIELDLTEPATVTLSVLVSASNPVAAAASASGIIRTAVHAAGGGTPDWPSADDTEAWSVTMVAVRSEAVAVEDCDDGDSHLVTT